MLAVSCGGDSGDDTALFADATTPAATAGQGVNPMLVSDAPATATAAGPDSTAGPDSPTDEADVDTGTAGSVAADAATPTLNAANRDAVIARAFGVYSGNGYASSVLALPGYHDPVVGRPSGPDSVERSVVCENGGTLEATSLFEDGARVATTGWAFEIDDCQQGGAVSDGDVLRTYNDRATVLSERGVSLVGSDRSVAFRGALTKSDGNTYGGASENTLFANVASYRLDAPEGVLELSDVTTDTGVVGGGALVRLSGGFTVSAPETNGLPVTVTTVEELAYRAGFSNDVPRLNDGAHFQTGRLELSAADGSRIVVEPVAGSEELANVTVSGVGASETSVEPWDTWRDALIVSYEIPQGLFLGR